MFIQQLKIQNESGYNSLSKSSISLNAMLFSVSDNDCWQAYDINTVTVCCCNFNYTEECNFKLLQQLQQRSDNSYKIVTCIKITANNT